MRGNTMRQAQALRYLHATHTRTHTYTRTHIYMHLGRHFPFDRFMAVHQLPKPCLASATPPPSNNNNIGSCLSHAFDHFAAAPAMSHAFSLPRTSIVGRVMQMRKPCAAYCCCRFCIFIVIKTVKSWRSSNEFCRFAFAITVYLPPSSTLTTNNVAVVATATVWSSLIPSPLAKLNLIKM